MRKRIFLVEVTTADQDADLLDKFPVVLKERFNGTAVRAECVQPPTYLLTPEEEAYANRHDETWPEAFARRLRDGSAYTTGFTVDEVDLPITRASGTGWPS